jgi:hypothetical protein
MATENAWPSYLCCWIAICQYHRICVWHHRPMGSEQRVHPSGPLVSNDDPLLFPILGHAARNHLFGEGSDPYCRMDLFVSSLAWVAFSHQDQDSRMRRIRMNTDSTPASMTIATTVPKACTGHSRPEHKPQPSSQAPLQECCHQRQHSSWTVP